MTFPNKYAGYCTGCHTHVAASDGVAYRNADGDWRVRCLQCEFAAAAAAAKGPTMNQPHTNGQQKPKSLNLDKLIKLLKLTTSPNDAEALLAARKANEILGNFGGDWEALLLGKVTIIADPFDNIPMPASSSQVAPAPARPAPRSHVPPRPSPPPPPIRKDCAHCGTSYNLSNGYGMGQRYCSNSCNTAANPPFRKPNRSTRMKPTLADL